MKRTREERRKLREKTRKRLESARERRERLGYEPLTEEQQAEIQQWNLFCLDLDRL